MRANQLKVFGGFVLVCCFIAAASATAYAQVPDVPGNVGNTTRPDTSAAENSATRKEAAERARTLDIAGFRDTGGRSPEEQFADYKGIAQQLGTTETALREEYDEAREDIPQLQPKHLFGAKMIVITASKVRADIKISKRDILKNLKNGITPLQYLLKRGFKDGEATAAYDDAMRRLQAIKNKS